VFKAAQRDVPDLAIDAESLKNADLSAIKTEAEMELVKRVGQWPRVVAAAARTHEPHRIAFYLYELAGGFHSFWSKGKENADLRFVNEHDMTLTLARLTLVYAVRQVLSSGLTLLGVTAPEELS
jgi:arginyl-tRNA synthetase